MRGKKKGKLHNHKHVSKKDKAKTPGVTGYISRTQVTKRLQLSIHEFRKLCIFKGIHPVEPGLKRIRKDTSKTWYFLKDINFMKRDEIVQWYRASKTYKKKVAYLKGVNRPTELAVLKQNKPTLNMDHFVRERYPTLQDAVNDLDDALSMICLFVEMQYGVTARVLKKRHFDECLRLKSEWMAYVTDSHTLRKVFVSIKGIYYQAEVLGSTITWLAPHPQRVKVPMTTDVLTMTFFVEFYLTMLNFVFYRLFSDAGYKYPPTIDATLLSEGQLVKAVKIEKTVPKAPVLKNETPAAPAAKLAVLTEAEKQRIAIVNSKLSHIIAVDAGEVKKEEQLVEVKEEPKQDEEIPDEFRQVDEKEGENKEQYLLRNKLFAGFKFFINREIPKIELRFMIRAFGGEDFTELDCNENDKKITHQIVDRDCDKSKMKANREYVQPQWVFDSINAGILLPYHEYAHDATLPPHISPFINDALKGYIPKQREHLDELIEQQNTKDGVKKLKDGEKDEEEGESKYIGEDEEDEDDLMTLEAQYEKELTAERDGLRYDGYVKDTLGGTDMFPDSDDEDADVDEALKKKPKTKKELQEEKKKKEAAALEEQAIGLLPAKLKRKVRSIKGRLERKDAQNEALVQKRLAGEKKQKKAAKEAHKALPKIQAGPVHQDTTDKKRKEQVVDNKPAKKARK